MWEWLKKQTKRNPELGVQTMADLFSKDVLDIPKQRVEQAKKVPQKVKDYFEPVPPKGDDWKFMTDYRTRDFIRELPGATGTVAKEVGQSIARFYDYVGRKLLPGKDRVGDAPTMEQFLFGGSEKRKDNLGDYAHVEVGIDPVKYPVLAPVIGGALIGLDALPVGRGARGAFVSAMKKVAKLDDEKKIFDVLKKATGADDKTVSEVAKELVAVKNVDEVTKRVMEKFPQTQKYKPPVKPVKEEAPANVTTGIPVEKFEKLYNPRTKTNEAMTDVVVPVLGNRKFYNAVKRANGDVVYYEKRGAWNGYGFPLEGKYVKLADYEKYGSAIKKENTKALNVADISKREQAKFENEITKQFPSLPKSEVSKIVNRQTWADLKGDMPDPVYDRLGRILNKDKIRAWNLGYTKWGENFYPPKADADTTYSEVVRRKVEAHIRHNMTDYDRTIRSLADEKKDIALREGADIDEKATLSQEAKTQSRQEVRDKVDEMLEKFSQPRVPEPPKFEGLPGLSTKVIEKLKGRSTVSSGFITNLLRSPDVTKPEREAILEALLAQGEKVNVKQFADDVQAQLLKLTKQDAGSEYRRTSVHKKSPHPMLAEKRGDGFMTGRDTKPGDIKVGTSLTNLDSDNIWQGAVHVVTHVYPNGKYHTTDVLSLKKHANEKGYKDIDDYVRANAQKPGETWSADLDIAHDPPVGYTETIYRTPGIATKAGGVHYGHVDGGDGGYFAHVRAHKLKEQDRSIHQVIEVQSDLFQRGRLEAEKDAGVSRLEPYKQTWWKRIAREEVQGAKDAGYDVIQFPTGETAMKVEGLRMDDYLGEINSLNKPIVDAFIQEHKTGTITLKNKAGKVYGTYDVIRKPGQEAMVIVSQDEGTPLGGTFIRNLQNVHHHFTVTQDGDVVRGGKVWGIGDIVFTEKGTKSLDLFEDVLMDSMEAIGVPGLGTSKHPIYEYYEKDLGKYLRSRYNAHEVTDSNGHSWYEIDLASIPKGAPVEAFAVAPIAGLETDEDGNIIGFDPIKAGLGMALVAGVSKAKGKSAIATNIQKGKDTIAELSPRRQRGVDSYALNEDAVKRILDAQRRHVIPHPQTVRMASAIPVNFQKLLTMAPGTIVRAEQAEAYKQAVAGYKMHTKKLRENHLAKPQDIILKKQYDDGMANLTRAYANMEALFSEGGRLVESSKIVPITRSPVINANIQKVRAKLSPEAQVKFDMDIENLDLDNPREVMDFLISAQNPKWIEAVVEYYRASLLSALTTQGVNILGNLIFTTAEIPVRTFAGLLSKGKSAITGKPREVFTGEAWKLVTQGVKSVNEATIHAVRALKDEHYQLQYNRSLMETGSRVPAIKGVKGKVIRIPYRFLSAMDLFFRTIKTNSEAEALLYRQARKEGLGGAELMMRMEELRRKPPMDILEQASKRADRSLFVEELPRFLKWIEDGKNEFQYLHFLVPFYRTLVNLMREAHRLTPGRLLTRDEWIKNPNTRMEEIARTTMGTAIGIYLTTAILDGRLEVTGTAPSDPKERDVFYGEGKQPYSIRWGDKWIPYHRIQPFSTILFSASRVAELVEIYKKSGEMRPSDVADAVGVLASEIAGFFTSQAPMQGIATFIEMVEGGKYNEGVLDSGADFFANLLGGFVPNIIFSGVRAVDPTVYRTSGLVENLKKRIPGMQGDLVPRRTAFGETVERAGTPLQRFLSPVVPSTVTKDPLYAELSRLETGVTFPQKKAFGQTLTAKEYDILLRDAGANTRRVLWETMQTPAYQNAQDDVKREMIDRVITMVRKESVGALFPYRREQMVNMEKLLKGGFNPREAEKLAQPMSNEEMESLAEMLYRERLNSGRTSPTVSDILKNQ